MATELKEEVELNSISSVSESDLSVATNRKINTEIECYRGDIFFIESRDNEIGYEMQKKRPGLIVSNDSQNKKAGMVSVVYLTTQEKKPLPTHVPILSNGKVATAMCEHIETVSKERLDSYLNSATDDEMKQINGALLVAFELNLKTKSKKNWELWEKLIENNNLSSKLIELENNKIKSDIFDLSMSNESNVSNELNDNKNNNGLSIDKEDYIKVCAERDVYKEMYNNLVSITLNRI